MRAAIDQVLNSMPTVQTPEGMTLRVHFILTIIQALVVNKQLEFVVFLDVMQSEWSDQYDLDANQQCDTDELDPLGVSIE